MDPADLEDRLADNGELMVQVTEFDAPIELHLHDTEINGDMVTVTLADGELQFRTDQVVGAWTHYKSLADYGMG